MKKWIYICLSICALVSFIFIAKQNNLKLFCQKGCPITKKENSPGLYSQFFEDAVLSIVFADVKKGFYIDVGANDPDDKTVTKYFYLKGWRGVNIEPINKHYLEFMKKRPEDINLNVGISDEAGSVEFYRIYPEWKEEEDTLSTFDKDILKNAVKAGYSYESITIPVVTLNEILEKHQIKNIDFLKIDVEGSEKKVLSGINLSNYRPKVFVIEATEPGGPILSDHLWKEIMIKNNYVFMLSDGLNHYYVAKEHKDELFDKFLDAFNCIVKANNKYKILDHKMIFSYKITD